MLLVSVSGASSPSPTPKEARTTDWLPEPSTCSTRRTFCPAGNGAEFSSYCRGRLCDRTDLLDQLHLVGGGGDADDGDLDVVVLVEAEPQTALLALARARGSRRRERRVDHGGRELVAVGATGEADAQGVELGVGPRAARRVAVGDALGGGDLQVAALGQVEQARLVARDVRGARRDRRGRLVDTCRTRERRVVDHPEAGAVEAAARVVEAQHVGRVHPDRVARLGADRCARRRHLGDREVEDGSVGGGAVVGGDGDGVRRTGRRADRRRAGEGGRAVTVVGERQPRDVEVGRSGRCRPRRRRSR